MADSDTPALEAASAAVEAWCRANPASFEPVAPAAGFGPVPERVTVSYTRYRCAVYLLGAVLDDEGRPVVSVGCDCAAITDLVLVDAKATPNGTVEFAFTCDGCRASHWMTFTIGQERTDG